jgi:hypothetical protein
MIVRGKLNGVSQEKPMEYEKPEVTVIGEAVTLVQSTGKGAFPHLDFALPPPRPRGNFPAYDLDE